MSRKMGDLSSIGHTMVDVIAGVAGIEEGMGVSEVATDGDVPSYDTPSA